MAAKTISFPKGKGILHIIIEILSAKMWYPKGPLGTEFICRNLWNKRMRNALGRHLWIIMQRKSVRTGEKKII